MICQGNNWFCTSSPRFQKWIIWFKLMCDNLYGYLLFTPDTHVVLVTCPAVVGVEKVNVLNSALVRRYITFFLHVLLHFKRSIWISFMLVSMSHYMYFRCLFFMAFYMYSVIHFFRLSAVLEIQWPQLDFCYKMNLIFKLRNVIIALLYSLSLSFFHTLIHWNILLFLMYLVNWFCNSHV